MKPFTFNGDLAVAAVGHPADNATSTTLTGAAAKSIEANAYENLAVHVLLKDPVAGTPKALDLRLFTKDTADGTVGDGTWTELAEADVEALSEKDHDPTLAATAAYEGVYSWRVPMRAFKKKYVNAIVVVTHDDPSATPVTYMALLLQGECAGRTTDSK